MLTARASKSARRGGIINALIGPIETLYNVRVATQLSRNSEEFEQARAIWGADYGVDVRRFVFHLSGELPLTWRLTASEKRRILAHWPSTTLKPAESSNPDLMRARANNQHELDSLAEFLGWVEAPPSNSSGIVQDGDTSP